MSENHTEVPKDDNNESVPEQEKSLGSLLKAAREERGFSLEQMALKVHLRVSLVKDIEQDCFTDIGSFTYARGYVKNFAKILEMDEQVILNHLEKEFPEAEEPAMKSFSRKTNRQSRDSRFIWLTYLLGIILVGLFVVWWLQKSSLLDARDLATPTQEEMADQAEQSKKLAAESEATPKDGANQTESMTTPGSSSYGNPATGTQDQLPIQEGPLPEISQVDDIESANVEGVNPPNDNELLAQLQMTLSGDCWIRAVDSTGEVLISGLRTLGDDVNLSGVPPINLTLGAPQRVTMRFDGRLVSLSQYPSNKVARLTLPRDNEPRR